MVPVVIPVLFINHTPELICCVPLDILLNILSIIVLMLLVPIFMLNIIDIGMHFKTAYIFFILFVVGSAVFVGMGYIGTKRRNVQLINAAICICVFTFAGYVLLCVYSVWSVDTLRQTSINDRCALTLWLFDWCEQSNHWGTNNVVKFRNPVNDDDYQPSKINSLNFEPMLKHMQTKLHILNTVRNKSVDGFEPYKSDTHLNYHDSVERNKRSLVELGVSGNQPWGPDYKKAVGYTLAVFFIITMVSILYTMFGYLLLSIKTVLTRRPIHITIEG